MMNRCISILLLIVFGFLSHHALAQDIFDREHSYAFANYLFLSGEYKMALAEYERLHFLQPQDTLIFFRLVQSYRLAGNRQVALEKIEKNLGNPDVKISSGLQKEYIRLLILNSRYNQCRKYLSETVCLPEPDIQFLKLSNEIMAGDFDTGRVLLQNPGVLMSFPLTNQYQVLLSKEAQFHYKKPAVAMILSGLIPGSGKVYTGNWKDGMVNFLMVFGSAFQSYRGFTKYGTGNAYGWIFGGISLIFYTGNIWGSGKAAHITNHRFLHAIHSDAENILLHYH